jgi:hypothetical protein
MLDLVASAINVCDDSCTPAQLKGESQGDRPIVSLRDTLKAVKATNQ